MDEVLFQKSFHAIWQHTLRVATEEVQKLDRRVFNDPALGGVLARIAAKYDIEVARFEGEATAKRRTEEREGRDSWGDHRKFKATWLDVSIPFVGEAETFRVAPSSWSVPNNKVTVGRNTLTISVADDDRADAAVESFKKTVSGNLQTLRAEYERVKPQLAEAIQQAADGRKAEIGAEDERDKKRSFTVKN
jgi:hypothetical protein